MRPDDSSVQTSDIGWRWGGLKTGSTYRVRTPFTDADGDAHSSGAEWKLRNCWFSKFDDEVTVFVTKPDGSTWRFRLLWADSAQAHIIEHPFEYLEAVV